MKYGYIKAVHFTIDQWNHFCRIMIAGFIQCIMKENLLLLKDLLESWIIKFINTWLQYQKMYILIN